MSALVMTATVLTFVAALILTVVAVVIKMNDWGERLNIYRTKMKEANTLNFRGFNGNYDDPDGMRNLLIARLRISPNVYAVQHISCCQGSNDKCFVFLVIKGEGTMIEDETSLFPSDALVTKVRLLL